MRARVFIVLIASLGVLPLGQPDTSVSYPAKPGAGKGKHVVLLSGDEEYRSEEALPMLGKILSQRHGFKSTVLFSVDPDGTINPKAAKSLSDPTALDTADAIVMSLRFRAWSDETMTRFDNFLRSGKPIVAMRTSTHAFNGFPKGSPWEAWNYNNRGGFGKRVLGETWLDALGQAQSGSHAWSRRSVKKGTSTAARGHEYLRRHGCLRGLPTGRRHDPRPWAGSQEPDA